MRSQFIINLAGACILLILFTFPARALATSAKSEPTTTADISRELNETLRAISSYSAEQRDAAVAAAKKALEKTDRRIDELQHDFDENRKSMSEEARKQAQETLNALRRQRNEIAEWLGGLKHSSASAWEEIKKGFSQSYRDLEKSLEKARQDF